MSTERCWPPDKIRCDACPVMCYIKPGAAGACDRYANHDGQLVRVDPHIVLERTVSHGGRLVPFQAGGDWDGKIVHEQERVRHRDRRRHHLSRLQARALHRVVGDRRRRHGHGRDRRHLQLLRRQGEDRHRPFSRARRPRPFACRARRSGMSRPANTARRCCRSAASII